ncbi:MAG: bifunctional glutamate N-acetyltransferase/amino-acid acetyltransferase ArgJ [Pseudomonadota bacterium]|nr:bifunctional glutamate N-acetyltransferase/amino-acid acetyltransferase ArgJ [Pseudomonadota bacterium]
MRRKSLGQSPFKPQKFGDSPGFAYSSALHKDVLNSYVYGIRFTRYTWSSMQEIMEKVMGCPGYRFAALHCGLKKDLQPDLALIVSAVPAVATAVFTTNLFPAAPVIYGRRQLAAAAPISAVLVNSGNANACTGDQGLVHVKELAKGLSSVLSVPEKEVFISSTGVIGEPLPVDMIVSFLPRFPELLSASSLTAAAEAIMTTDSQPKTCSVSLQLSTGVVHLCGLAKGAGMIEPNMATMLAYLLTDAEIPGSMLQKLLVQVVDRSFNRISVDGDTSTNDTVLLLANGVSGCSLATEGDAKAFAAGLYQVADELSRMIVKDGEGATKMVEILVRNAPDRRAAEQISRTIAHSLLVKTAFYGEDANWGRIIAALGYAGVDLDPGRVDIWLDRIQVVAGGQRCPGYQEADGAAVFRQDSFTVAIDLHAGDGSFSLLTADLSHEYVSINADYRT